MSFDWVQYIIAILFALTGVICVASVLLSLPGTWVMIGLAIIIELIDGLYLSSDPGTTFGWTVILIAVALGIVGEIFEFLAGATGARAGGSSRRGMFGALIGGIIGAILGTFIPVPLIGTIIGAIAGTFIGAIVGELLYPEKRFAQTIRPATGASIGRLLGTLAKVPVAFAVWLILVIAAFA